MNVKAMIPLGLAGVLGLVAAVLVRNAIAHKASVSAPATNLVSVVVAKQDIEPGHDLTLEDLSISKVPAETAPGQIFSDPAQLVGRVVTTQLLKDQTILETLLAPTGTGAGLQALVPLGMRAMTLQVNEYSGVGGMLCPGCHIDVISVLNDEKTHESIARTILQDLKISAVGHSFTPNPTPPGPGESAPPPSNAITVLCTPKQAQVLQLALIAGRPWFVLRSTDDGKELPVEGTTMAELRGDSDQNTAVAEAPVALPSRTISTEAAVPVDAPPAVTKRIVQILRGGAESQVTFIIPVPPAGVSVDATPDLAPAVPGLH
jgi:pilus assembly protein CpaB